jgi:hypothetical protein
MGNTKTSAGLLGRVGGKIEISMITLRKINKFE